MIVSGGIGKDAWQVSSIEHTNASGRVLKRIVLIDGTVHPFSHLTLTAPDALRLATAIRLVAKNGATH